MLTVTGRHVQPDLHRYTVRYNTKIGRSWNIRYPGYAPGNCNQIYSDIPSQGFLSVTLTSHFDPVNLLNLSTFQTQF